MRDGDRTALSYAGYGPDVLKPTRHSGLAGVAWAVIAIDVVYRSAVIAYAYHRSPTYPWARFHRNVGDLEFFLMLDRWIVVVGAFIAVLALITPNRKRALAWGALAAHLYLLATVGGVLDLSRA